MNEMQTILIIIIVVLFVCSITGIVIGVIALYNTTELKKQTNNINTKIKSIDYEELSSIQLNVNKLITDIRKQYLNSDNNSQ